MLMIFFSMSNLREKISFFGISDGLALMSKSISDLPE